MRPLYLGSSATALEVTLDGPALRVCGTDRADGLYPLRRVSRVVVKGRTQWQTEALLACVRQGISVVFVDRHGDTDAVCFGARQRERSLNNYLRELLEIANYREYYDTWLLAMERRAILAALQALHIQPSDLRRQSAKSMAMQRLRALSPEHLPVKPHMCFLSGLLLSHATEIIGSHGLPTDLVHCPKAGFNLIFDLVTVLEWDLYPMLAALMQQSDIFTEYQLILAFEAQSDQRTSRIHTLLNGLEQRLREILT